MPVARRMARVASLAVAAAVGLAAVVTSLGSAASAAPAARADATDVVCRGGIIRAYLNPGLTFIQQTVRISASGDLGDCEAPGDPTLTGGTFRIEATGNGKCPDGFYGEGQMFINWNNGKTSVASGTAEVNGSLLGVARGTVTQGAFKGATGSWTGRPTQYDWFQCFTPIGVNYGEARFDTVELHSPILPPTTTTTLPVPAGPAVVGAAAGAHPAGGNPPRRAGRLAARPPKLRRDPAKSAVHDGHLRRAR